MTAFKIPFVIIYHDEESYSFKSIDISLLSSYWNTNILLTFFYYKAQIFGYFGLRMQACIISLIAIGKMCNISGFLFKLAW